MTKLKILLLLVLGLATGGASPLHAAGQAMTVEGSKTEQRAIASPEKQANDRHAGIEIKVNINSAGAEELSTLLSGIGLKKAQAIVQYREAHGKFNSVDALTRVKGIGAAIVERNRSRIEL